MRRSKWQSRPEPAAVPGWSPTQKERDHARKVAYRREAGPWPPFPTIQSVSERAVWHALSVRQDGTDGPERRLRACSAAASDRASRHRHIGRFADGTLKRALLGKLKWYALLMARFGHNPKHQMNAGRFLNQNAGRPYCDDCLRRGLSITRANLTERDATSVGAGRGFIREMALCCVCGVERRTTRRITE